MVIHYSGSYYRCKSDIMHLQITVVKSINKGVYELYISGFILRQELFLLMIKAWKHKSKTLPSGSLTCSAQGYHGKFFAGKRDRCAAATATIFYSAKSRQGLNSPTSCGGHDAYYCSQINKEDYLLESIWLYSLSFMCILKVEMLYVGMILLFF